jgi:hypothetical protein
MDQPLFGLVAAGQPVLTVPTSTPSPTSFLYAVPRSTVPGSKPFSHITVFLLPGITLPPDTAAAIYLVKAGLGGEESARFLGGIGPGKESAIFNLGAERDEQLVIGISIEPAISVAQRIEERGAASSGGTTQQPNTQVLAQRIIKNAFNFLAGFSGTAGQVEVVPLKAFEDWWRKFESRVRTDPGFLERDD